MALFFRCKNTTIWECWTKLYCLSPQESLHVATTTRWRNLSFPVDHSGSLQRFSLSLSGQPPCLWTAHHPLCPHADLEMITQPQDSHWCQQQQHVYSSLFGAVPSWAGMQAECSHSRACCRHRQGGSFLEWLAARKSKTTQAWWINFSSKQNLLILFLMLLLWKG